MNDLGILLAGLAVERMRDRTRAAMTDGPEPRHPAQDARNRRDPVWMRWMRFGIRRDHRTTAKTISTRPA